MPLHTVEQHSLESTQVVPVDLQRVALQVPGVPEQAPEQQSRPELQSAPVAPQNGFTHLLPVQVPEQHSAGVLQVL